MTSKITGLPYDEQDWSKIAEPAKDAYWQARRKGEDESRALLAALKEAILVARRPAAA